MAAPTIHPTEPVDEAPETWLLAVFALLIVAAMVPIGLLLAAPSVVALVFALAVVIAFAIGVCALLARMIGPE
jgi:hypothetical protein